MSNKTIVVSFRITPWKLAKMLDGIRKLDPTYEINGINKIVMQCINNGIGYMCHNLSIEPSVESLAIVETLTKQVRKRPKKKQAEMSQEQLMKGLMDTRTSEQMTYEQAMAEAKRIEQAQIAQANKGRAQATRNTGGNPLFTDIDLGSEKNSVTDFRPMSEEELDEKD